jgi:uncharacterized protein (DUF2132 family)
LKRRQVETAVEPVVLLPALIYRLPTEISDMISPPSHPRDPLHGITLEKILQQLVQRYGWSEMGRRIPVRCFKFNPTMKSSLTFLRKTPWARQKVEDWFIGEFLRP